MGMEHSVTLKLDDDDINAIEDSFFCHLSEKRVKEIRNRLCRIWKDICSQVGMSIAAQYTIVIEPDEDGFHAFCPALKGCHTCGNTQAEALRHIQDAIVGYVASLEKHGDPVLGEERWILQKDTAGVGIKEGTMNYYQVIGPMPGGDIEPAFYLYTGDDAWPSGDTLTWTDDSGNLPTKVVGRGYCFHCDRPVKMEYDRQWIGDGNYQPPKTCLECGGHDVEFMGRAAKRLWECIETLDEWPELVRLISIPR